MVDEDFISSHKTTEKFWEMLGFNSAFSLREGSPINDMLDVLDEMILKANKQVKNKNGLLDYQLDLIIEYNYVKNGKKFSGKKIRDLSKFINEFKEKNNPIILPETLTNFTVRVKFGLLNNGSKKMFKNDLCKYNVELIDDELTCKPILSYPKYKKVNGDVVLLATKEFLATNCELIKIENYTNLNEFTL